MGVQIETPESLSDADGVATAFPTGFTFTDAGEVRVFLRAPDGALTPQVAGVDYDLAAGDWPTNGADVVFRAGHVPVAPDKVLRRRVTAAAQPAAFGDQASFRPQANEEAFDRVTRALQEERAKTGRALGVPVGEAGIELPPQAVRDGKLFVPDGAGVALLDEREKLFVTDADGKVRQIPLVAALQEIGVPFDDFGLLTPGGVLTDDYGALI